MRTEVVVMKPAPRHHLGEARQGIVNALDQAEEKAAGSPSTAKKPGKITVAIHEMPVCSFVRHVLLVEKRAGCRFSHLWINFFETLGLSRC